MASQVVSFVRSLVSTGTMVVVPTGGASTASVMVAQRDTALGTAVFTLRKSNRASGPWYALDASVTITPGGADAMSGAIDCSPFAFLGIDCTTAEGATVEYADIYVYLNGADR